jgi:exonuclease SbcC
MRPVELQLSNFLSYRNPGSLQFEGIHIACLAGPNGAGKSSLLDAITWGLWGKARTASADDLIHQGQSEMRVALTFMQGDAKYRVIRQRTVAKRGTSLLELQGWDQGADSWRQISESTIRETQAKIDRLVGLDYETFVNSAFLMQGRADEFTTKTPSLRKQILSSILGLAQWEAYEERAKEKIAGTKAALERMEIRIQEIDRELGERSERETALKSAEESAGQLSVQLEEAERTWKDLEGTRSELVTLQRTIDDLTIRITSREKELAEARTQLARAKEQANTVALRAAIEGQQQTLKQLEPLLGQHEDVQAQAKSLSEGIAHLKGINQTLGPETEPIKSRVQVLRAASEPVCPTCGQSLSDEHRHQLIDELSQQVETRREQYRENRDQIAEDEGLLQELEGKRKQLEAELSERAQLERKLVELETALRHADEAQARVEDIEGKIARWQAEVEKDHRQRADFEGKADTSEARLRAATLTQDDLDRLRLEKRKADERVGGARQQLAALEALENQREERIQERNQSADDLGIYQDLREAFGKRGVPAMIIETAVPELERTANELLSRMTDGRMHVRIETQREIKTGEIREALDIIISDELGSRPYELYSGGESFRINFAIRIALSKLLARRAGAQLRSLYIDEGFGTQDARGREQLVAAINSIQHDFDLILVITHIDELKEAFSARIEVEKTLGGSFFRLT